MRTFKRRWTSAAAAMLALSVAMTVVFSALATAESDAFQRTWMRTDKAIVDGQVSRTWMWGPMETAFETTESYVEAPGGERQVMYFDKSRMEVTYPAGDPNSIWYVTNGLLSTELITGRMQMGDSTFEQREPAQVNVAGDANDPNGPTYATFGAVLDIPAAEEDSLIIQRIDRNGMVTDDPDLAERGVTAGAYDAETDHTVATPFWEFMTSVGIVWENGSYTIAPLFENPVFATGRPITEAYWAEVQVGGNAQGVLIQCFERRCLTYTPDNDPGWQVEAGNVGQHYYQWRYGDDGGEPTGGDPAAGEELFSQKCSHCHSIDGGNSIGPALNGLYGSTTMLIDGTEVFADEAYIRESILDPGAKRVIGSTFPMPDLGITDEEADDLVAYIKTLE